MSLIDYGRILLRRGWIMVLLAVIAAVGAYLFSRMQTPQYRATQLVLIQPARPDLGLAEGLLREMNSYQVFLRSTERAQEVIDSLSLDMLADSLLANTVIEVNRDNLTVQIDVTLEEGALAAQVARRWGELFVQYREQDNQTRRQEDRVRAILPDRATFFLYSPRTALNVIAGAVLGLLVGGVLVFVLEFLESAIIHRREDIERLTESPLLAAIPDMEASR
jgi:capsular polysaccharide biosynthesis protein